MRAYHDEIDLRVCVMDESERLDDECTAHYTHTHITSPSGCVIRAHRSLRLWSAS